MQPRGQLSLLDQHADQRRLGGQVGAHRLDRDDLAESVRPVGAADVDRAEPAARDLGEQPVVAQLGRPRGCRAPWLLVTSGHHILF
jgi:hypothetical protein